MPSSSENIALANLQKETGLNIKTIGFKKAVKEMFAGREALLDEMDRVSYVPDGYVIGPNDLVIFEVEITHHLPAHKLIQYAILFDVMCEYEEISFKLITVDKRGLPFEVDLAEVYANWAHGLN